MNTTEFGNVLEKQVHDYLFSIVEADLFWVRKENCRFYWKKGYYSAQRKSDIIFDVAIEVWMPGGASYSLLILIECKRYTKTKVPVGDIEQFFQKVQQVAPGNSKAVLISNAAFESGTRTFAESNGIALGRFLESSEVKWELYRPSSLGEVSSKENDGVVDRALSMDDVTDVGMDLHARYGELRTNSFWDFSESLISDAEFSDLELRVLRNTKGQPKKIVPYVDTATIEEVAHAVLEEIGYRGGKVSLEDVCRLQFERSGLIVSYNVAPVGFAWIVQPLGRITFNPPRIDIFEQPSPNVGRERFTLAHELAHLILGHSRYLKGEIWDEEDQELSRPSGLLGAEIARLEMQANLFATSLLMPKQYFFAAFGRAVQIFDVRRGSYGPLYLDEQDCNRQTFYQVTNYLMSEFGVSRSASKLRLQTLGILYDAREEFRPASTFMKIRTST